MITFQPAIWKIDLADNQEIFWLGNLLPPMTQEQSANSTFYDGFHTASLLDFFSFGGKLYEMRNETGDTGRLVSSARQFIQDSIRTRFPMTSTRADYKGGRIIHNYGTSSSIVKEVNLIGLDGKVNEVLTEEQSLALTGKTPQETANIMNYLNGTSFTYLWRLNEKPVSEDERVVRLDAYSVRFFLSCDRHDLDGWASFGVKVAEKNLGRKS